MAGLVSKALRWNQGLLAHDEDDGGRSLIIMMMMMKTIRRDISKDGEVDVVLTDEDYALDYAFVSLSAVSLALVAPLVLTFLLCKPRKFPSYLVLSFLLCSLGLPLFSLFNLFFGLEYMLEGGPVCTLQAVGIQFFASGLAWAWFFVGVNLYLVVIWQIGAIKLVLGRVYVGLTWIVAIVQTLVPLLAGVMGPASHWCWVTTEDHRIWQIMFFYAEVGFVLFVGVMLWARLFFTIVKHSSFELLRSRHGYLMRHALLVTLFVGVMAALFTYRMAQVFEDPPSLFFQALHVVGLSGQGLVTFVSIGVSRENYRLWKGLITAGLGKLQRCARRRNYEDIDASSRENSIFSDTMVDDSSSEYQDEENDESHYSDSRETSFLSD